MTGFVSWAAFAATDPGFADVALGHFRRGAIDEGLLATVRGDGLPRVHPVYVAVAGDRLVTVVLDGSAKLRDLRADGRFALHAHQDPAVPHELLVRGRATELHGDARTAAVDGWAFEAGDGDGVFELRVAQVTLGERADPDAWPPVYRTWRAA